MPRDLLETAPTRRDPNHGVPRDRPSGRGPSIARRLIDLILPPRCLDCGSVVDRETALCSACWPHYDFIAPPYCACCGFPFEYESGAGETLCAACMQRPPAFERARAVLAYGDASRPFILDFKHGDRTGLAPSLGTWLARAGASLVADADIVAPVPLHRARLFARRYNQSAILASALARAAGLPMVPDLLVRRRATRSQGRLSPSARRRNVQGAFMPGPAGKTAIDGRRVLLVDDVFTTGATVEECARALIRAGAVAVDVLTLARVARPRAD